MRLLDTILSVKQHGVTADILKVCSRDELRMIHRILDEYESTGGSDTFDTLWKHDFEEKPVSIDEFLDNDYYLGKIGKDVFPKWMPDLRKVCSPLEVKSEWIVKGAVGIGKTYVADIALLYKMYYLSCLRDPARFYGLGSGSPIVFGFFNIYKYLVRATSYQYLVTWLRDMSPYFKRWRMPKDDGKESDKIVLNLPKGMRVALGAQAIHALGQNLIGGLPLVGDTLIGVMGYGGYKSYQIRDMVGGYSYVYGLNEYGNVVPATATAFSSGRYPIRCLVLDNGIELKSANRHRWLTPSGEYKYTGELEVGDSVSACPYLGGKRDSYKIERTEDLGEEDTFCLRVPRTDNYALDCGVWSHNCDEAEFGRSRSMTSQEKSQIADLYSQVRDRIDSRFMQRGGANPGLLILISSAKDYESFLEPHTRARGDDENVHVSSYSIYDIRDDKYGESERFKVVVGDKFHQSFIPEDDEVIREDAHVIEVPVEFKPTFKYDIDTAIRNVAGIPTRGSLLFYPRRNQLKALLESCKRRHPFSIQTIELSIEDSVYMEDYLLIDELTKMVMKSAKIRTPRYHPKAFRYVHVDLAKNRDAAGLAMCCLPVVKTIDRIVDDRQVVASDFVVFVDLMVRIKAATGSEIDFSKVSRFIFFLKRICRFPIRKVTYDQYQSTESIQKFKKSKIVSEELSVDRNPGPYRALKQVCLEGRFDAYYYDIFFNEMTLLEDRTGDGGALKNKIDHNLDGSKDVSDAVCGATFSAMKDKKGIQPGADTDELQRRAIERARIMDRKSLVEKPSPERMKKLLIGDELKNPLDKLFGS